MTAPVQGLRSHGWRKEPGYPSDVLYQRLHRLYPAAGDQRNPNRRGGSVMAQAKGATSKGASRAGAGGTVTVVLPAATAKDLLNALTQAVGGGLGAKPRAGAKPGASRSRAKATARAKPAARAKAPGAKAKAAAPRARAKG